MIEIERLHKRYGDVVAVDDVSLTIEPNEVFGIIGTNGAGKTTTVECHRPGVRTPDRGTDQRCSASTRSRSAHEMPHRVGVQLQASNLPDRPERLRGPGAVRVLLSATRATPDALASSSTRARRTGAMPAYGKLSGGEKQRRVASALALVGRPQVAVLDELTTGLDPHARRDAWRVDRAPDATKA